MDKLKEHKLLIAIIGGLVVTLGIYLAVSSPAIDETSKALSKIDEKRLDKLKKTVAESRKAGEIASKKNERIALLRELYECYRVYLKWSHPLKNYRIPGTESGNNAQVFTVQLASQMTKLEKFYSEFKKMPVVPESFQNVVKLDPVKSPFDSFKNKQFTESDVELGQKQFWVLVELVNALHEATEEAAKDRQAARQANPDLGIDAKPVCYIDSFTFDNFRPLDMRQPGTELGGLDVTRLATGIPFTMKLMVDIEVWPHLRAILHNPKSVDPNYLPQKVGSDDIVRQRSGIRFDRLSFNVGLAFAVERMETDLGSPSLPNEELIKIIKQKYPRAEILNGKIIPPPNTPDEAAFLAEMSNVVGLEWAKLKAPPSNFVNITLKGEALNFLPDPTQVNFWKNLQLSEDDIFEILANRDDSGQLGQIFLPDAPFKAQALTEEQLRAAAKQIHEIYVAPPAK